MWMSRALLAEASQHGPRRSTPLIGSRQARPCCMPWRPITWKKVHAGCLELPVNPHVCMMWGADISRCATCPVGWNPPEGEPTAPDFEKRLSHDRPQPNIPDFPGLNPKSQVMAAARWSQAHCVNVWVNKSLLANAARTSCQMAK